MYRLQGYVVPEGYDFSVAHHPQEKMCYQMAEASWEWAYGDRPDYAEDDDEIEDEEKVEEEGDC